MSKLAVNLSNEAYDILKQVVEKVLPAAATLYFALSQIWGFPNGEEVVGSIAAVTIFLGVILGLSRKGYNEGDSKYSGTLEITDQEEGPKLYSLQMAIPPEELDGQQEILFKVETVEG